MQDIKFLWSKLLLGGLYTDDTDDTNDDDTYYNTTRRTEHDCIGSLPNEPKKLLMEYTQCIRKSDWELTNSEEKLVLEQQTTTF